MSKKKLFSEEPLKLENMEMRITIIPQKNQQTYLECFETSLKFNLYII